MGSTWLFSERLFIRSFLANAGTHGLVNWLASPCINKQQEKLMTKQIKDDLQKWMDKHVMVMTLSDDKKQEKKIKQTIERKVRESLTGEKKND
jgi:hypothetical protein